jgi:hypothetical protein
VSPESVSAPTSVPVAFAKMSAAMVSVKAAVGGVARVGALLREMDSVELAVFPLPAASLKALPNTLMVAVPTAFDATVKVDVYDDPDPLSVDSVPPEVVTTPDVKFVEASDNVKVMVSEALRLRTPEPLRAIEIVGRT